MTDGQGRTVDFTNTVVIMTSNLGSQALAEEGLTQDQTESRVREALRAHFRPEFLNRIDDVVVFHRLTREEVRRIVDIQVRRLAKVLAGRDVTLEVTDAARDEIAKEGFDPVYGARPLKRLIQSEVQNELARRLLAGEIGAGDSVVVDFRDGAFDFERRAPVEVIPPEEGDGPARDRPRPRKPARA
jgi:ATP-dependent Clp protease ATP-binding subunit ClpB